MLWVFAPVVIYAVIFVLHLVIPARRVSGYVTDEAGMPLRYRLNGLLVLIATVGLWAFVCSTGALRWNALHRHFLASAIGAIVIGLIFTAAIVIPAPATGKGLVADLFFGRFENPQWNNVDAKMFLYLVGAVMLELNVLSAFAHHREKFGFTNSNSMLTYTVLFSFFVVDYLFFEEVHLYTYDLFAERVGFKLGWGCLAFYPFFYAVGATSQAGQADPERSVAWRVFAVLVFFSGWLLSRGANMQKFFFKTRPTKKYLGLITPEVVSDGKHALLDNGFWGLSRHVNYLGEVLMASGLALALGRLLDPRPWLYPLYYVLLLVPRQFDDDKRCAAKYGALWDEYRSRVPKRIIPWVY